MKQSTRKSPATSRTPATTIQRWAIFRVRLRGQYSDYQNHARTSRGTWSNLPGSLPFMWREAWVRGYSIPTVYIIYAPNLKLKCKESASWLLKIAVSSHFVNSHFVNSHFVNSHLVNFPLCQFPFCQFPFGQCWQSGNWRSGKLTKWELIKYTLEKYDAIYMN